VNIITGQDLVIKDITEMIYLEMYMHMSGRMCAIGWDALKPNGTPRKLLDVSRLREWAGRQQPVLSRGLCGCTRIFAGLWEYKGSVCNPVV
jgi:GDP-L-fucose synthase